MPISRHLAWRGVYVFGVIASLCMTSLVAAQEPKAEKPPAKDQPAEEPELSPEEKEKRLLLHFMRRKLEASSEILEGLSIEDFTLIKEGATKLYKMSTVEKWRRSNDALYRQYSSEFQRVTQDLIRSADQGDLDRSALKWMDVTMKCIECHRYVRETLIISTPAP